MRLLSLLAAASLVAASQAAAQAPRATSALAPAAYAASDTAGRISFSIPGQPLPDALRQFSRQAAVRVEVDLPAAAGQRSQPVSGSYTPAEALRRLLGGSGLSARFTDEAAVQVGRAASLGDRTYTLTAITVHASSSQGYNPQRTTSVTRTDTPLRDAPQAVTVVTEAMIADQGMQGMADVVRYVPGATMGQGEGHRDAPTIRGISTTADFFVDGVRDDVQYLRDLYNVERVEVLKGANALAFGRGGGGGVINRVTKDAGWAPTRALTVEGGSFDHRRVTLDVGQGVGARAALRLNGMYENSDGFRDGFELERYGVAPTLTLALGAATTLRAGYERFSDDRTVDRGVPSFQGRPSDAEIATFFGNPDRSYATARVHGVSAAVEHATSAGVTVRSRVRWADYRKFYQNSYPSALDADGTEVTLAAYNNAMDRRNLFNQTDLTLGVRTGGVRHTLLVGTELGRQETDNLRHTGYYNGTAAKITVPFASPTVDTPITFRQSASDADNRTRATIAAVFVQDQVELSRHVQLLGGVRFDRFDLALDNHRTDRALERRDDLVSPRAGIVLKPSEPVSVYGSYSITYLPASGEQFSSLTPTTEALEPERFTNYEVGTKWDVLPSVSLTTALYRLDRTNTAAPDPNDPTRLVQTGSQRTTGVELGVNGSITEWWQVSGGFAAQRARITSTTSGAAEGNEVPLVPGTSVSLWNRWQVLPAVGVGLGIVHQDEVYAAIDNQVTLPGFTRADAALFVRISDWLGAQLNVENLFDERYYPTSHGNNNIMPGAPRTLRLSLTTRR